MRKRSEIYSWEKMMKAVIFALSEVSHCLISRKVYIKHIFNLIIKSPRHTERTERIKKHEETEHVKRSHHLRRTWWRTCVKERERDGWPSFTLEWMTMYSDRQSSTFFFFLWHHGWVDLCFCT